jgi:glycosyltransferase involved in cell wall biosynthesis
MDMASLADYRIKSQPLVSAIIVFLNAGQFIEEAIESVRAQTYDHWELLLVDDGSKDASTQIALRYAERYAGKVRYFEHEGHQNRGISAARNLGINNAKGEYIAFLDADDVWLPQKLDEQVAILESQPEAAMVYGPGKMWNSWKGNSNGLWQDRMQRLWVQPNVLVRPPTLLTLFLQRGSATPSPSGILVRQNVMEHLGGFEETAHNAYEDQTFYAKVCIKVPIFVADKCWYKYRLHPESCSSLTKKAGGIYAARLKFLEWLEEYLSKERVTDITIKKVLQKHLWIYRYSGLLSHFAFILRFMKQTKILLKSMLLHLFSISLRGWRATP